MTWVKEFTKRIEAIDDTGTTRDTALSNRFIRHRRQFAAQRVVAFLKVLQTLPGLLKRGAIFWAHRAVELAVTTFPDHGDHLITHAPVDCLVLDVLLAQGRTAARTHRRTATGRANAGVKVKVAGMLHRANHRVTDGATRPVRLNFVGRHTPRFLGQPRLPNQRHGHRTIRARAGNRARPQIGHGVRATGIFRIEIANLLTSVVKHPRTPTPHIGNQGCARFLAVRTGTVRVLLRVHQRRKLDDMRDGVEVKGIGFAAQAQRLQGNSTATGERVKHAGGAVGERLLDVGAGVPDVVMSLLAAHGCAAINTVIPIGHAGDEMLHLLRRYGVFRLRHQGGEDGSTAGSQRSPRPPNMQGGEMPVANRLLAGAMLGDLGQGHLNFDNAAVVGRGHRECSLSENSR